MDKIQRKFVFEDNFCHIPSGDYNANEVCCYVHSEVLAEHAKQIIADNKLLIGSFNCDECDSPVYKILMNYPGTLKNETERTVACMSLFVTLARSLYPVTLNNEMCDELTRCAIDNGFDFSNVVLCKVQEVQLKIEVGLHGKGLFNP